MTGFGDTVSVVVVTVGGFTFSVVALEVEGASTELPEYMAVRLSAPVVRPVLVKVTIPVEFMFTLPSSVVPLKKFTVPRDSPVGVGVTVTVKVTVCPTTAGFGETPNVVTVVVS